MSWLLFDWANSAFSTVVVTFVFSAYFTRQVAPDPLTGTQLWGLALAIGGLFAAVIGPFLGATTDQTGRRKPWLIGFTWACVLSTALLWFVYPETGSVWRAVILLSIGILTMDLATVLYNASLVKLAPRERIGRWSGWGWGVGYAGGLASLIFVLVFFLDEQTRIAAFDTASAQPLRASFIFVAVWFAFFSLPLLIFVGDTQQTSKTLAQGFRDGCKQLGESICHVRQYKHILRFLIARMFYVDALVTLFAFGGVYAVGTFGMDEQEVLLFGIFINVSAGIGAFVFAWLDDRIGSQRTILVSLGGLILSSATILTITSIQLFWIVGAFLGLFVGPVQAASRSYLARVAPPKMENQMFGLYALSGKATAFLGPTLVSWLSTVTSSQRAGLSAVVVLFALGFILMLSVPTAARRNRHDR